MFRPGREHETKYVFPAGSAASVVGWLHCRCRPDPEFPAGIVSTIYYDTRDWRFLGEKINSDFHKTKVRVRWYYDFHSGEPLPKSFLEVKYKIGGRREKVRFETGKTGEWLAGVNLDNPELTAIPRSLWPQGLVIPGNFYPALKIVYKRKRFIEPETGARISVDYDISAPAVNFQMMPRSRPFSLETAVVEMKGTQTQLPPSLRHLIALGCKKESFSKYGTCCERILQIT